MTSIDLIYYIIFPIILSINGAKTIRNNKNAHTNLITGYSQQCAEKNDTKIFRVMTHKTEKWRQLLESHYDVNVKLLSWLQKQTTTNIYKKCDEMNLTEFLLIHDTVNTTHNILLRIDSDCELNKQITNPEQIKTECNLLVQSAEKVFPIIHFCNWETATQSPRNDLQHQNIIYSLMPRIFVSGTEHKYHNGFSHSLQQSKAAHKAQQDSRGYHMLSRRRRKHHVHTKKYRLLKLYREQEKRNRRKTQRQASDVLKIPIGKRKPLCKYRKSCYNTGIIPDTWNIYNILPRFMNPYKEENSSKQANATETQIKNENEGKKEISEEELKLLCRYRKSCYKEMGAETVKSGLKIQERSVFSRNMKISPSIKPKSTKEIAKMALVKLEERIATLQPIMTRVITPNEDMEKMKKRLACKYRKSCYRSGILPEIEIDITLDNMFRKIYHFFRRRNQEREIQKEFKDFDDDRKRVYCKYRKSCYNTGQKPTINHGQIFKYTQIVKKYEETMPLEIRCKYRKSCYNTRILPDLKKKDVPEKKSPVAPVQTVTSLKHLKTLCKYRKSCYKQKAGEQQISDVQLTDETKTHDKKESERKKEKRKEEAAKSFQKGPVIDEQTEETSIKKLKVESPFETETIKEIDVKKQFKKTKISIPELKEIGTVAIQNEKLGGFRKKKTKKPAEEIPIRPIKKIQNTVLSPTKQPITQSRSPERLQSKKEKLNYEKIQKKTRTKDERNIKENKVSVTEGKDFEKELLITAMQESPSLINEVQSVFLQARNMTRPREVNIYDENLSPLDIKISCKYRKSCYESGKLPSIETSIFRVSTAQILSEHKKHVEDGKIREQLRLRCKYRKSCYTSGILPPLLNETAYVVTTSIKQQESTQLKCKYRKSCYESMKLDKQLDKVRKQHEQKKMQEGIVKEPYRTESDIKEKEPKKEAKEEVMNEESKQPRKKKSKELKSETKEHQYMQIEPLDKNSQRNTTELRSMSSAQKLKCKYRIKCYNGVPLQQVTQEIRTEKKRQVNIKDFRRANGAVCHFYYISCRKQAGLPVTERAPIGPNGQRLCRKKKKEEITH